jgi:hypothetical protein
VMSKIKRYRAVAVTVVVFLVAVLSVLFLNAYKEAEGSLPITVHINGLSYLDLDGISFTRITGRGRIETMPRSDFGWVLSKRGFCKELRMTLSDRRLLDRSFTVDVRIGDTKFSYASEQIFSLWETRGGAETTYAAPLSMASPRSRCPLFASYLNWSGDCVFTLDFLRKVVLPLALVAFLVALLFVVSRRVRFKDALDGPWVVPLVVIAFCAVAVAPALRTWFISDDAINSNRITMAVSHGVDLPSIIKGDAGSWLHSGRLFPVNVAIMNATFAFFGDAVRAYKAFLVVLSLLSVLTFIVSARSLGVRAGVAYGIAAMLPILWQLRDYHDPVLAFNGFIQILFIFFALSLCALQGYVAGGRIRFLFVHALCFLLAILQYELAYCFLFFYCLLSFADTSAPPARRVVALVPSFLLAGIVALASLYLRHRFGNSYAGTTFSLHPAAFIRAFAWQVSASLPLVYGSFNHDYALALGRAKFFLLISSAVYGCFVVLVLERSASMAKRDRVPPWLVSGALGLIILPAAIMSLTSKYQQDLGVGKGYLPVYFQYFGVAVLVFALAMVGLRRSRFVVAFFFSILFLANASMNDLVADKANDSAPYMTLLKAAMKGGIFSDLPDGTELVAFGVKAPNVEYSNRPFLERYSGKRLSLGAKQGGIMPPSGRSYLMRVEPFPDGHGYILLADSSFRADIGRFETTECTIFLAGQAGAGSGELRFMSSEMARKIAPDSETLFAIVPGTPHRVRFGQPVLFETIRPQF